MGKTCQGWSTLTDEASLDGNIPWRLIFLENAHERTRATSPSTICLLRKWHIPQRFIGFALNKLWIKTISRHLLISNGLEFSQHE